MPKTHVLLVDDHRAVLEALEMLFETEEDIEVVGAATGGMQAIEKAKALKPDLVIMDYAMSGIDGIQAAEEIKKVSPQAQVIMLSVYDEAGQATRARKAGVAKWISKNDPPDRLIRAVKEVARARGRKGAPH